MLIIGGGAAGLTAAIAAAREGAQVVVLEKGPRLGHKVLIAGNGRCNVTNANGDLREFVKQYPGNGRFLYTALSRFDAKAAMAFFEELGVPLVVERGGRVFPKSQSSKDVVEALIRELKRLKVEVRLNTPVTAIENDLSVKLASGETLRGDAVIVATGGKSFPGTGSTGDGFKFAKALGLRIVPPFPALIPLKVHGVSDLMGLALKNVEAMVISGEKVLDSLQGEMLFTHNGVSGPIILTLSRLVSTEKGPLKLGINLKPALNPKQLEEGLMRDWSQASRQQLGNALKSRMPARLVPHILKAADVSPERMVAEITREERKRLVRVLQRWEMPIEGTLGIELAIVTAGGVDTRELDPKTLESKSIKGLYWVGEVVDVDGVTGGYNLQAAWSMGMLAGRTAAMETAHA